MVVDIKNAGFYERVFGFKNLDKDDNLKSPETTSVKLLYLDAKSDESLKYLLGISNYSYAKILESYADFIKQNNIFFRPNIITH